MKSALLAAALGLACASAFAVEPAQDPDHDHRHGARVVQPLAADPHSHEPAAAAHAISLDNGRKWATDGPLRDGMTRIRDALAAHHPEVGAGSRGAAQYEALASTIETNVASIVANCKLSPEADRNLHVVVAELVAATDDLRGKSASAPAEGVHRAVAATNLYGRYFNHPGWKPLA